MSKCKKCCKEFKYQWCLDRHLRRKTPCKIQNTVNTDLITATTEMNTASSNIEAENTQNTEINTANKSLKAANAEINKIKTNQCKYCSKICTKKSHLQQHMNSCKEKDDHVRCLEMQLNILYNKPVTTNTCRFCNATLTQKSALTRHVKTCKVKQKYRENLEAQLQEKTKQQPSVTNNNQTINNNTINVLNISAETLRKFGEENTDHITNSYLRHMMGRLGVTIPKVVSNVAKKIYCDDSKPENQTIQISNVRSQWAKVSNGNGNDYELQALGDSIKGVRNRVTDLYVERLCDDFEYFKKVNARIDKLDDLNNQNYTARTLEDKEDQKNASKLKSEIDREIKSTLYNVQKNNNKTIKK